jgi:pimeloyl-ACP methyl ester carboxylesterase
MSGEQVAGDAVAEPADVFPAEPPAPPPRRGRWLLVASTLLALVVLAAGAALAWAGDRAEHEARQEQAEARIRLVDVRAPLRRAEADRNAIRTQVLPFADAARTATAASARVVDLERALVDRLVRLRDAGSSADAGTYNRIVAELNDTSDDLVDAFTGLRLPLDDFSRALQGLPTARCTGRAAETLRWTAYGESGLECARLRVPLDHAEPGGEQIELTIVRRPADDPSATLGPLVLNPGGPGLSGVAFLREATLLMPAEILRRFDLVTFDPRGVGRSTPVDCGDDLDPLFLADLTAPTADARVDSLRAAARVIRGCAGRTGSLLRHVDTATAARDLDRIRAALGVEQLNYLGYSYGTYLGAVYADLFPRRVRAAVLDAAVHPQRADRGLAIPDPGAFASALDTALEACGDDPACPFARNGDPQAAYDALMTSINNQPLDVDGRRFGRTPAELGVVSGLYRGSAGWPELWNALAAAAAGDGRPLSALTDRYTGRRGDGSYTNQMPAHYAINCTDLAARLRGGEARRAVLGLPRDPGRFEAVSVLLALPCAFWSAPPVGLPSAPIDATEAAPILVVGGEHDPATPIQGAEAMAGALRSANLLRWQGTGHTAFGRGNDCIDTAVTTYLVELRIPADDTTCPG